MSNCDKICADCGKGYWTYRGETCCEECQKAKTDLSVAEKKRREAEEHLKAAETRAKIPAAKVALAKTMLRKYALLWVLAWLLIGAVMSFISRSEHQKGCVYRSVASILNPGYVLGCELFRERWEIGK